MPPPGGVQVRIATVLVPPPSDVAASRKRESAQLSDDPLDSFNDVRLGCNGQDIETQRGRFGAALLLPLRGGSARFVALGYLGLTPLHDLGFDVANSGVAAVA